MKTTKSYQYSILLVVTVISLILSACAGVPAPANAQY